MPRVIGERTEKRDGKTYKVVVLAPGPARGARWWPKQAWQKPLTAKHVPVELNAEASVRGIARGDRIFHRGTGPRPVANDERVEWLRPMHRHDDTPEAA